MSHVLGPTLETERLILRPTALEDFEPWFAMMQNEDVAKFIGNPSRYMVWRLFSAMAGAWALKGHAQFSIIEKASGKWVGRCGPWRPEGWPGNEVAYTLARPYWGKGYATEAATAAINWAFSHLGWADVVHCIDPQNINSQNVAKRLGSELLKTGVPLPPDEALGQIWGQTREQWSARKKPEEIHATNHRPQFRNIPLDPAPAAGTRACPLGQDDER